MRLETPSALAQYRLVEKIGEGGMGAVWKALDTRLDREVAIKILPEDFARNADRVERFEREARAVAALNHPNIVTIYSVEQVDGIRFLSMELVHGATLSALIPEDGFALGDFLDLAVPLADAVHSAHACGVTHRDLKPANVMVREDGRPKVLDFGLAEFTDEKTGSVSAETTTAGLQPEAPLGTLPYMSPEQLQSRTVDHRTDIFSLSVMFYEMVTGRRPFQGFAPADLVASILRDVPKPVTRMKPGLPRQLERIFRHGLHKDPRRRFQTALDLRNELDDLRGELTATSPVALGPEQTGAGSDPCSIAILPLENLSGDPDQEYFADGMTDALIADLAKIGALRVISRTSVMLYKGVKKPLRQIAAELGVGTVVEGSVLRVGDRVRITAQLIQATADRHLWAESYERDLGDILGLQGEVARTIAEKIQVKLTPQEQTRLDRAETVHPRAHEACLRGRHFWYKRTPETVSKGLDYFKQSIRLDPTYAPAHTGVADSYIVDGGRFLAVPPEVAYTRARDSALEALRLDDSLAEAHTSLAAVMTDYDWDWPGADREYRRAIELNPSYVTAHAWYAEHLSRMGRHEEAILQAKRARELDPLSLIINTIVSWIQFFARHYEEAIEESQKTLDLDPSFAAAQRILGWAYEEIGRPEKAIAAHRKAADLSGGSPNFKGQLGRAYALAGRSDAARGILDELLRLRRRMPISALDICLIYLALDGREQALRWLTRAIDERCDHIPYLKVNPRLDPLRMEPGFRDLLQRMHFPES